MIILKSLLYINIFLFCITNIKCQNIIIYKDDILFKTLIDTSVKPLFEHTFYYRLKKKLPDGQYIVYNSNRKQVNANDFLLFKGQYLDSLREGLFEFYDEYSTDKTNNLILKETYQKGNLNGLYVEYNKLFKLHEGIYLNGSKCGNFISYDKKGSVKSVSYFEKDLIKSYTDYNGKKIHSMGLINYDVYLGEYRYYDENENLKFETYYDKNNIVKIVEYYKNGIIKKISEGEFLDSQIDIALPIEIIVLTPLLKGKLVEFNENGKIISQINK